MIRDSQCIHFNERTFVFQSINKNTAVTNNLYSAKINLMRKLITLSLLSFFLYAAGMAQQVSRVEDSPFKASAKPDTLYYTGKSMTESETFATGSLSGILARTKPMIMQWQYFHQEIVRESGLGYKIFDTYSNDFTGLLRFFAKRLNGYILCDPKSASSNVAASLSGILNAVAIPTDIEAKAIAVGLTKVLDVTGKDELWALANYKNQLNKDLAFFQSPDNWLGLVDYSAYTGGIRFYDPSINGALADSVYNFLNPGAMFYGWWVSEDGSVGKMSQKSFKIIPCGGLKNLATFTNLDVPIQKQKESVTPYKVEPGVHTVCFVISDGDNIGWVAGAGYWDAWIWKNDNQSRMNLGFTLSPALCELTPLIYNDLINGLQTTPEGRSVAVASPSGLGYYFPSLSPNQPFHCEQLNKFMKKADMSIVNVIDNDNGLHDPTEYLKQSNIDALFYYTYGAQYTGMKGKISWYKGKPSIGGRFTFWGNSEDRSAITQERVAQSLANVLNSQSTSIYTEAGYSLIPVHIWTENPTDVLNLINKLGPKVRVVAPDEFVWLIKKNLGNLPMGTGAGLKAEYFKGTDFDTLSFAKIDKKIDFEWLKSPVSTSDNFSVRWSGQIQPLYSEEYTFSITSGDGARLTIDGTVLFDSLQATGSTTKVGKITLVAGQKHDIVVEYRSTGSKPGCMLEWESASHPRQVVPFTQLYSGPLSTTGVVTVYKDKDRKGFSAGLKIGSYTTAQLIEKGILQDEISSIKLMEGFKAIAYSNDNFTGDSLIITAGIDTLSNYLMSDNTTAWDDNIASVKIKANGDTTLTGAFFLKNKRSGFYMEVAGGITSTDYNTNIRQYSYANSYNQVFQLVHQGDGVYKIMARHSKMVLTVAKMGEENANVHQWKYHGSASQEFIIVAAAANTMKLISTYSGMVVNVTNNTVGGNVQMNTNSFQLGSMWTLVRTVNREGTGSGLKADYYNGKSFNTFKLSRIDPQVLFNWGTLSPAALLPIDNFSVRWTGSVEPRFTGTYTFDLTSDNGRKLWVNDQLIIDKWTSDWGVTYSGTISLKEMTKYNIKVEYFEEAGGADIRLEWSSNFELKEVIPQSQLYPEMIVSALPSLGNAAIFPYPNPVKNILHINGLDAPASIVIYDAQGKKVLEDFGTSVNTDLLSGGFYFLHLQLNGKSQSFKFIKEK